MAGTKRVYTGKKFLRKRAKTPGSAELVSSSQRVRTRPFGQTWPFSSPYSYLNVWDPFPAKQMARLRYSTDISITPTTGLAGIHTFRANSINDPDQTGVGHQPYGHDTYATIYNSYRVVRATIVVRPTSNSNCIYGVNVARQNGPITDYDLIKERKGCKFSVYNSNGPSEAVTQIYDSRYSGQDDAISADFGSNPNDQFYFNVWCTMQTAAAAGAARDFQVCITYDVLLYDLIALSKS